MCSWASLTDTNTNVYADSAYAHFATLLPEGTTAHICEKGCRGTPLTDAQKESNRAKSKVCCRIEHVFGFMTGTMKGVNLRSIGRKRAEFNIGLINLVYTAGPSFPLIRPDITYDGGGKYKAHGKIEGRSAGLYSPSAYCSSVSCWALFRMSSAVP